MTNFRLGLLICICLFYEYYFIYLKPLNGIMFFYPGRSLIGTLFTNTLRVNNISISVRNRVRCIKFAEIMRNQKAATIATVWPHKSRPKAPKEMAADNNDSRCRRNSFAFNTLPCAQTRVDCGRCMFAIWSWGRMSDVCATRRMCNGGTCDRCPADAALQMLHLPLGLVQSRSRNKIKNKYKSNSKIRHRCS